MRVAEVSLAGDYLKYKSMARHEYVDGAILEEGVEFFVKRTDVKPPYTNKPLAHYHQVGGSPFYFSIRSRTA